MNNEIIFLNIICIYKKITFFPVVKEFTVLSNQPGFVCFGRSTLIAFTSALASLIVPTHYC
jgi:hypothetical protein